MCSITPIAGSIVHDRTSRRAITKTMVRGRAPPPNYRTVPRYLCQFWVTESLFLLLVHPDDLVTYVVVATAWKRLNLFNSLLKRAREEKETLVCSIDS